MKKIILIVALLFLSACTQQNSNVLNEYTADPGMVKKKQGIKPALTPDTNLNNETSANNREQNNTNNQQSTMSNPRTTINESLELKDLAQEYSGALIKTNKGDIEVKFYAEQSPLTVNNFLNLAEIGFYDGTRFHRIIDDFMIQGGDPNTKDVSLMDRWGTGGPNYRFKDEINKKPLVKGSLAMANSGPNTNGSQFFIVTKEATPWLDGLHTNFGEVVEGMDVVEQIEGVETGARDVPVEEVVIEKVELLK